MSTLPIRPSFSQLQKQAKALRKDCQSGAAQALARLRQHHPDYAKASATTCIQLSLRDAQLTIAREYGEDNWKALKEKAAVDAEKNRREEILAQRIQEQTSSTEEIERIIRAASGSGVRRSQRITRGFSCEVHWITTDDGQELMYRANWYKQAGEHHFENEKWALQRCEKEGIPAPRFRHVEHGLPGHPYRSVIVNERVPGQPLRQALDDGLEEKIYRDLLEEAGALLGRLHQIKTDGFGILDSQGRGPAPTWRAAYMGTIDEVRLQQSAHHAGLDWPLVAEGLQLLENWAHLGDGVSPRLLPGEFDIEHIIVDGSHVISLIDFEYCKGGDPADEAGWSDTMPEGGWWDQFTGEVTPMPPTEPLIRGYAQTAQPDAQFQQRYHWLKFMGGVRGLSYHGVNDINTAGMMDFLNERYRKDLDIAKQHLG